MLVIYKVYFLELSQVKCRSSKILHMERSIYEGLDHHDLLEAAEEEPELVNEGLDHVLQMRPHVLELVEVTKLVLK